MNGFDFAADTTKIENIITDIEVERNNMDTAITNIYDIITKMNDNWEGSSYETAKKKLDKFHEGLNSSVTMVDKIITILNSDNNNAKTTIKKIKDINN